jgi:uncharacterized protein (DUF885 family)
MNQTKEEINRLMVRQLADIQSQASKILSNKNDINELEGFSKYSNELKAFVLANSDDELVLELANGIPYIHYKKVEAKLWHWLVFGHSVFLLLHRYFAAGKVFADVEKARSGYASIHFLLKSK